MKTHWTHDPIRDVFYHWVELEDRCEKIGHLTRAAVDQYEKHLAKTTGQCLGNVAKSD